MPTNLVARPVVIQPPATQETVEQAYYKAHPFTSGLTSGIVVGVAVGFAASYWSHWLANRRDDRKRIKDAKSVFGIFIQKQIDDVPERNVVDFYNRTRADIRGAVIAVRQEFKRPHQRAIDNVWDKYDKQVWQTINAKESPLSKDLEKGFCEHINVAYNPERNQDRLITALKVFYKFSR